MNILEFENRKYYKYLNGLKGMSCVLVMLFHYLNIYQNTTPFPHSFRLLDDIITSEYSFLLRASFWFYLFFLISGYLLAQSRVLRIKDIVLKTISRFLRLALPIFFVAMIICLLNYSFGFHTLRIQSIINNKWLRSFYNNNYSLSDFLMAPIDVLIFKKCVINSPYWVLREMLIASVLIYILAYINGKLRINRSFFHLIILVSLVISYHYSEVVFSCIFGAVLAWYEGAIMRPPNTSTRLIASGMIFLLLLAIAGSSFVSKLLFFSSLILLIPLLPHWNNLFSSRLMQFLGDISFGIYSFHWPVFCSIGLLIILNFPLEKGLIVPVIVGCIVSLVITVILSYLFHISFERLSRKIVLSFSRKLSSL